jgi:hypothetical protein
MKQEQRGPRRKIWAIAAIALMLALMVAPLSAGAAVGGCRVDPILVLSNGLRIQVDVTIDTVAGNISSVDYEIHGPTNTRVVSTSYAGNTSIPENVTYIADAHNGTVTVETTVNASVRADVEVIASAGTDSSTDGGRTNHRVKSKLNP